MSTYKKAIEELVHELHHRRNKYLKNELINILHKFKEDTDINTQRKLFSECIQQIIDHLDIDFEEARRQMEYEGNIRDIFKDNQDISEEENQKKPIKINLTFNFYTQDSETLYKGYTTYSQTEKDVKEFVKELSEKELMISDEEISQMLDNLESEKSNY